MPWFWSDQYDRKVQLAGRICLGVMLPLFLLGCSTERTLDRLGLEAALTEQLLPDNPGLPNKVTCPEVAEPAPAMTFMCQAALGEQTVEVEVVLGGTDEALTSTASIEARLVAANEIGALLAMTFGDELGVVTSVDCGQAVVALPEGDTLTCAATDPTGVVRRF